MARSHPGCGQCAGASTGTYVVSARRRHVTSSRITHYCEGRDQYRAHRGAGRSDAAGLPPQRHRPDAVLAGHTAGAAGVEQRDQLVGRFPAPLQPERRSASSVSGPVRTAPGSATSASQAMPGTGRAAVATARSPIATRGASGLRTPHSGLLVRCRSAQRAGRGAWSRRPSRICRLNVKPSARRLLLQEMHRLDGYKVEQTGATSRPTSLDSEGLERLSAPPPGFEARPAPSADRWCPIVARTAAPSGSAVARERPNATMSRRSTATG